MQKGNIYFLNYLYSLFFQNDSYYPAVESRINERNGNRFSPTDRTIHESNLFRSKNKKFKVSSL
jgi:hypothetical protein